MKWTGCSLLADTGEKILTSWWWSRKGDSTNLGHKNNVFAPLHRYH